MEPDTPEPHTPHEEKLEQDLAAWTAVQAFQRLKPLPVNRTGPSTTVHTPPHSLAIIPAHSPPSI